MGTYLIYTYMLAEKTIIPRRRLGRGVVGGAGRVRETTATCCFTLHRRRCKKMIVRCAVTVGQHSRKPGGPRVFFLLLVDVSKNNIIGAYLHTTRARAPWQYLKAGPSDSNIFIQFQTVSSPGKSERVCESIQFYLGLAGGAAPTPADLGT